VVKVRDEAAGKRLTCPGCQKSFLAPKRPPRPKGPPPVRSGERVWHLHVDGRNVGPYSAAAVLEQRKTGKINNQTLAWREGMEDWLPIGRIAELRRAPGGAAGAEAERRPRHRYVPGQGKKDIIIGAWVAVGLAVVLLVVILLRSSAPSDEGEPKRGQPTVIIPGAPGAAAAPTSAESGQKAVIGPRPTHAPKRTVRREVSREKLMAWFTADLDKRFKDAIAGHKRADRKPIKRLIFKCKDYAEQLRSRQWGGYQSLIDTIVERLNAAATGMDKELAERSLAWGLGEGVSMKKKAELLELDKVDWLERWHSNINEDIERLRKKGMNF